MPKSKKRSTPRILKFLSCVAVVFVAFPVHAMEKLGNREFDNGLNLWLVNQWNGATMTARVDGSSPLSGANAAKIVVTKTTGTDWHLQLRQSFDTFANGHYSVTFTAKCDAPISLPVWIQEGQTPFATFARYEALLTTTAQTFTFAGTAPDTDTVFLTFVFGLAADRTIWIDNVSVMESGFAKRHYHGAFLEPVDTVIHGAGQDPAGFAEYTAVMGNDAGHPLIYMAYTSLVANPVSFVGNLRANLEKYMTSHGHFLLPQIGLSLVSREDDVALGALDANINAFGAALEALGRPFYLRIGYEANGVAWNDYDPANYITAYRRITDMLRARNLEMATVWCIATDGASNFMNWYPGDAYVDWWAIDLFSISHFTNSKTIDFMARAQNRGFPVMIGETTPRHVGVLDGQQDWDAWFIPFFSFIHTRPNVKAFCYINWEWSYWSNVLGADWSDWGDCRLQKSPVVSANYREEMGNMLYLHAQGEAAVRIALGVPKSGLNTQANGWELY